MNITRAIAAAAVSLALVAGAGSAANAQGDIRTVVIGPVHCHPIACTQKKVITTTVHGGGPLIITKRRRLVLESRTSYLSTRLQPWSRWHVTSVVA